MATSRGSNGALFCRDDHGWRRGRNLCALPLQTTNDYSEIGRLNEEEILMLAVTGVLFKWPLIRQIRGRGYGTGMEAMSDKERATIPLIRKDQPKYPSKRNSPSLSFLATELLAGSLVGVIALHWRCPEALNPPFRKRESASTLK
jgi:hypothetical protein